MIKHFNLQLFADGSEGSSGTGQGAGAGTGNGGQAGNAGNNGSGSYSFQQAEEIANARAQRAERAALSSYFKQQGMSEDEINQAIRDFKANREKQQPNVSAITKERDDALAERLGMGGGLDVAGPADGRTGLVRGCGVAHCASCWGFRVACAARPQCTEAPPPLRDGRGTEL